MPGHEKLQTRKRGVRRGHDGNCDGTMHLCHETHITLLFLFDLFRQRFLFRQKGIVLRFQLLQFKNLYLIPELRLG